MTDDLRDLEKSILPRLDPAEAGYLRQELDDLRDMVRRGDPFAVSGGLVMAWWALVIIFGSLAHILQARGMIGAHVPVAATEVVAGYAGNIILLLRSLGKPYARSWRNQTLSAMWFIGGIAVFVFVGGCYMAGIYDPRINLAFIAMLYAMIMTLTALVGSRPWMILPALGWAVVALAVFRFNDVLFRPALFGSASFFLMLIPGLVLTWQERRAV